MDAGIASTILFSYPIITAVLMTAFFHERITWSTTFSILLAVTGIGLLYRGGDNATLSTVGVALVIGLITALIVTGVMKSRLKSVAPQRDATSYVRQGSMKLTNQRDLYLYREVHRTERPKETDSGSSGGSSTHTSSSGSTHGGGGGSF